MTVLTVIKSCGFGIFMAGSPFFFTRVVGLEPVEVGLGISLSAGISLLTSVPLGVLMDRHGTQRLWIGSAAVEALLFALYPFVPGLAGYLVVMVGLSVVNSTGRIAIQVYSLSALPPAERVRAQAFQRSALNVGFTLGGAAAGVAMAFDTVGAYRAMVWSTAAMLGLSAIFFARLPGLGATARRAAPGQERGSTFSVLRDPPVLSVSALTGILHANATILMLILPLWIASRTDAPKPVVATLFVLNTVLAVIFQVWVSRGADTASGAAQALRRSALSTALACLLFVVTIWTKDVMTILVLVAGTLVLTYGELTHAAGSWGVVSALSTPERRGEYVGAFHLGDRLQRMVAPIGFTALALETGGGWGWLVIAGAFVLAGSLVGPAVAWAERRMPAPPSPPPELSESVREKRER
ncbi:MFS transporter [Micromonospora echinospora]|nr:MFS transporter [Micromonospora echinospora]